MTLVTGPLPSATAEPAGPVHPDRSTPHASTPSPRRRAAGPGGLAAPGPGGPDQVDRVVRSDVEADRSGWSALVEAGTGGVNQAAALVAAVRADWASADRADLTRPDGPVHPDRSGRTGHTGPGGLDAEPVRVDRTGSTGHTGPGGPGRADRAERIGPSGPGGPVRVDRTDDAGRTEAELSAEAVELIMMGPRKWLRIFYALVGVIALVGQTMAAVDWLGVDLGEGPAGRVLSYLVAGVAVATLEVGGIAILSYADARRRLNEQAFLARVLSAGVAAFAVWVNWRGHLGPGGVATVDASFFAGMSALGYLVYLISTEARRRDRLRAERKLPPTPPVYETGMWLRHPWITRRARALAKANPEWGTYKSWAAADEAYRREGRNRELAAELRSLIAEQVDPRTAEIAVKTFDLDEIAARVRAAADYDGLAAILSDKLTAERITGTKPDRRGQRTGPGGPVQVDRTGRTGPDRADRTGRTEQPSSVRTGGPVRRSEQVNEGGAPDRTEAAPDRRTGPARGTVRTGRRLADDATQELPKVRADQADRTGGPDQADRENVTDLAEHKAGTVEVLSKIRDAFPGYGSWVDLLAAVADRNNAQISINKIREATGMGKGRITPALKHASDDLVPYKTNSSRQEATG